MQKGRVEDDDAGGVGGDVHRRAGAARAAVELSPRNVTAFEAATRITAAAAAGATAGR